MILAPGAEVEGRGDPAWPDSRSADRSVGLRANLFSGSSAKLSCHVCVGRALLLEPRFQPAGGTKPGSSRYSNGGSRTGRSPALAAVRAPVAAPPGAHP